MDVVYSAVFGWAKTLSSSVQITKDVKYLDLQGIGENREAIFQLKKKKKRQVPFVCYLSAGLSDVLLEKRKGK